MRLLLGPRCHRDGGDVRGSQHWGQAASHSVHSTGLQFRVRKNLAVFRVHIIDLIVHVSKDSPIL